MVYHTWNTVYDIFPPTRMPDLLPDLGHWQHPSAARRDPPASPHRTRLADSAWWAANVYLVCLCKGCVVLYVLICYVCSLLCKVVCSLCTVMFERDAMIRQRLCPIRCSCRESVSLASHQKKTDSLSPENGTMHLQPTFD